jgi:predicted RNase H-like HicB family nuclease
MRLPCRFSPEQVSGCTAGNYSVLFKAMKVNYTYWQEPDGFFLGYLDVWPEHWTQGKTIPELEEMLSDLYEIYQEDEAQDKPMKKAGTLELEFA